MATFEELGEKSQGKVLKEHPEFHSYPEDRKAKIVKDRAKKDARNQGDVKRYNKDTNVGADKVERAIAAAQTVVAARQAKPSTATSAVSEPKVTGRPKTELESLKSEPQGKYELSDDNPFKIHSDNPAAKYAIDDNKDHSDMMGQVGMRLEQHRLEHEGETDDVSDLGRHITRGFEALNDHDDAHMGGDVEEAKAKIKEAAQHFSTAASLAHSRYGDLPRVHPESLANEAEPIRERMARPLGTWAVDIANGYIRRHAEYAPQDKPAKGFGKGMRGRVLRAVAGVDNADDPKDFKPEGPGSGRKAELTMAERARANRESGKVIDAKDAPPPIAPPTRAQRRSDRSEQMIAFSIDTDRAKKETAQNDSAPASRQGTRPVGAGARYLGPLATFGSSGTPVVPALNRDVYKAHAEDALQALRQGKKIPNDTREALGQSGVDAVYKAHKGLLKPSTRRASLEDGMEEGK
jgi:hypothetical protein